MHNKDEELGKIVQPERVDDIVHLNETDKPGVQLSLKDPDSLLPSLSLVAPFASVNDDNDNTLTAVSPLIIPRSSSRNLTVSIPTFEQFPDTQLPVTVNNFVDSPNSVSSSAGMQQPISTPNALRALGFPNIKERSPEKFNDNFIEHLSIGETSEVNIESPVRLPAVKSPMSTLFPTDVTHLSGRAVTRQNSTDSIDIESIEKLLIGHMEYNEVEVEVESLPKMLAEQSAISSVVPIDIHNSSERTIDSIEKLISKHLEFDDAELTPTKSKKPDFNRQSSDLKSSCRLTSSEKELLDDLFRPIETNSTSLPQDLKQEERARREVEAAAQQQATIDKKLQEEQLREEERRLDLLTRQAHREAMQKAEERFMAAEAENERLQQEAADNELKVIEAAKEETERQERERFLADAGNVKVTTNMKASNYAGEASTHPFPHS